ncbi:hypothetical protein D3C72_1327880 [compost metagenome]
MGDVDEGDAERGLQLLQFGAHADFEERIERRKRLVQQQRLGIGDERTRQRHALLLPTGKLGRTPVGIGLKLHQLQHLKRLRPASFLVHTLHLEAEGDIVDEIEMWKQRVGLEHHRRAASGGRQIGHHRIAEPDITAGDALVTSDHPERRGLAAARRAEQAAIAPGRYLEAYRMHGGGVAVNLGYGSDVDCCGFAHKHSPATSLSCRRRANRLSH